VHSSGDLGRGGLFYHLPKSHELQTSSGLVSVECVWLVAGFSSSHLAQLESGAGTVIHCPHCYVMSSNVVLVQVQFQDCLSVAASSGINVTQGSTTRNDSKFKVEHTYSFGRASHASGMGGKNAEVIRIMVPHGDVTEPARLTD